MNGEFLSSTFNFLPLIYPTFTCVDPYPYSENGSGSTKFLLIRFGSGSTIGTDYWCTVGRLTSSDQSILGEQVLDMIRGEFPELKIVTADQLMFVKEDLIIPQHNTFYVR